MKSTTPAYSLFRTLTWLTLFFAGAQILYFSFCILTAGIIHILAAQAVTTDFLTSPVVFIPLLTYLGSQALVYSCYIFAVWYLASTIGKQFSLQQSSVYSLGIVLWIACTALIVAANSIYFKQSIFAAPSASKLSLAVIQIIYWLGLFCVGTALLITVLHLMHALYARRLTRQDTGALLLIAAVSYICIDTQYLLARTPASSHATLQRPNIILISIEALRPEYISQANTMPFLAEYLQDSIQFTDAYTPIAQSFPSWISLLTGKTPLHHGARSFYINFANIRFQDSLTYKLKQHGYETMYAVDGQRFGDMTTNIGIDRIISPPSGAAELVIGSMSDFPLSNLLLATRLGKHLFPYSYANRTIAATYHPDDFIDLLTASLRTRSDKPLFLSVHFGLSHWPYRWADDLQQEQDFLPEKYRQSLHAADEQIKKFQEFLRTEKLLDHAVVVFISDHGTGLGLPGDSLTNENKYVGKKKNFSYLPRLPYSQNAHDGIDTSYGYSTNILSLQQYRILLAFKTFGIPLGKSRRIATRVSLLDIAPTLLELLHINKPFPTDGISLMHLIRHNSQPAEREFFFENGFTSPEIAQANISMVNVLQNTIQTVLLDPDSGLLYLTDPAEKALLKNKQRAVLAGDWLLARQSPAVMVLANIKSGQWTTDWSSSLAKSAPLQKLLRDFKRYNGAEL